MLSAKRSHRTTAPSASAGRITSATSCAPRGVEEQRLGAGVHLGMGQVEQQLTHTVADARAARLAGRQHWPAGLAQIFRQQLDLRCLAAAV